MLITMLADRFLAGGVLCAKGTQVDVSASLALEWIGDKVAEAVGTSRETAQGLRRDVPVVQDQLTSQQYAAASPVSWDGSGRPTAASSLGAYFPNKMRRSTYGRKVASWGGLQNSAGTATVVTPNTFPPYQDNATKVLRLDRNATASFGQQNPIDGGQAFMPKGTNPGFSVGIWVQNPNSRTLNFRIDFFNPAANHQVWWNCAVEPTGVDNWVFLTMSPSQSSNSSWAFGTDAVGYVRVTQSDTGAEGAWNPGEYLLFGNVYVDVQSRPRALLTFDDGISSQSRRNPGPTSIVSGAAFVSSTAANVLTTAAAHGLLVGVPIVFPETPPTSLTAGVTYYVQTLPSSTTLTLATDAALQNVAATTGFAGTARWQYGGSQARTSQDLVESYGFRGTLFIVPKWLGTSGVYGVGNGASYMSADDLLQMWKDGWSVGSHSNTHPFSAENAGLRLLGPYGYYLSNTFDNLPAQYLTVFGITAGNGRRRATSATQASPSVVTFENAHQFVVNQPIVWTDVAPTGFQLGVTYYVRSIPSGTTATFATDQGSLANGVNNTTGAWSGTANYRYPGSTSDDSAIYADVVAGAEGLRALGIQTGYKFFALPQGASDPYVRSACIRAGIKWVRGIGPYNSAHTIPVGAPTGGGLSGVLNPPGGWMGQVDAVQTDGSNTLAQVDTYIGDCLALGATCCNYHHGWTPTAHMQLERMCQTLRSKSDAGLVDVMTLDEYGRELGL